MKKGFLPLLFVSLIIAFAFSSCTKEEENGVYAVFQSGQFVQNTCDEADDLISPNGIQATSIFFKNESSIALKIYWINTTGGLTIYHENVAPGQSKLQPTYLQHPWYITTADEECIAVLTALRPAVTDTVTFRD